MDELSYVKVSWGMGKDIAPEVITALESIVSKKSHNSSWWVEEYYDDFMTAKDIRDEVVEYLDEIGCNYQVDESEYDQGEYGYLMDGESGYYGGSDPGFDIYIKPKS